MEHCNGQWIGWRGNPFSLRVEGTGFGLIQEVTDLRLTQVSSAVGSSGVNAGTVLNPQVNRTSLPLTAINNDAFYISSTDGTNTPLPVELVSFNAVVEGDAVKLEWSTASELNNDFFVVERMSASNTGIEIGRVNGQGTVQTSHTYSLYDENPQPGLNYYRLRQTDFDGTFTYSKIISVYVKDTDNSKGLNVYPNPAHNEDLTVEVNDIKNGETVTVVIFAAQKSEVFSFRDVNQAEGSFKSDFHCRVDARHLRSAGYSQ